MLNSIKEDVKAEVLRLKKIKSLNESIRETSKNRITIKNKDLSSKLVTNNLRMRFKREIEKFGVFPQAIEIRKTADRNAESFFKVVLEDKPESPIGEVLSEGEHRCVSLAAFLAELVTSNNYSGIVFDDPMSSLDHIYRSCIAKRLVEEAKHRQVVIFTHDLTFLFELSRELESQVCEVSYQTIRRREEGVGYIENDIPLRAKSANKRENSIRSLLKNNKGYFDNMNEVERSAMATGIITQIRMAWEQAIADIIQPVMARFDNNVKPGSLYKLLVLDENDVKVVNAARSRLSEGAHSSSEALNPVEVKHSFLVAELDKFKEWFGDIKERQKKAKEIL